jgi:hypothetical protein
MNTAAPGQAPRARQTGRTAYRLLATALRGKILAAFSNAAYLYSSQQELLWLVGEGTPMHRRCVQISGPMPRLTADSLFRVEDQRLVIGSEISVDFSRASIWEPSRFSSSDAIAMTALPERVCSTMSTLEGLWPPKGLGNLLPEIMLIPQDHGAPRSLQKLDAISSLAWPTVQRIAKACLAHDIPQICQQAKALVGLGEGLTPSGDDFVGGLLFCRAILQSLYPELSCLEFTDQHDFIEDLKPYTNIISFTILKDHADGYAADTLHRFVNSLLAGESLDNICPLASEITQIGHSTGWDLLTGVLTGMLLVFHRHEPCRH